MGGLCRLGRGLDRTSIHLFGHAQNIPNAAIKRRVAFGFLERRLSLAASKHQTGGSQTAL